MARGHAAAVVFLVAWTACVGQTVPSGHGCIIMAPRELHIEYSSDVSVEFAHPPGTPDAGSGSGGSFSIVLDGNEVQRGMRCPASFKLKGLAAGTHTLDMVPEEGVGDPLGSVGGGEAAPRQFFVASEGFWAGGQWSSPPPDSACRGGGEGTCKQASPEGEEVKFWILVPAYNAAEWIGAAVGSVRSQAYSNWRCIVVDDASTDGTGDRAEAAAGGDSRISVTVNPSRIGAAHNLHALLHAPGRGFRDGDVVAVLDGDDWLSDPGVLSHLAFQVYSNTSCWVSYGSLVYFPMGVPSTSPDFPPEVVRGGGYRGHPWVSTHLRTAKYGLWRRIREESFRGPEGDWLDMTSDMATMFALLEMHCAVGRTTYSYNMANPINDFRVSEQRQAMLEGHVRGSAPYDPLLWW